MPLYEYRCEKCGEQFEVMQKFSDEPLSVHDKCGGFVHRLLSAPALQFKGSGWYITDYARSGGEKTAANGDKKAETPAGASSGGSESTPASSSPETKSEKKSPEKKSSSKPSSSDTK